MSNTEAVPTGTVLQEVSTNPIITNNDFSNICNNFMHHRCTHRPCKFIHDKNLCFHFYKGQCKYGNDCKKNHFVSVGTLQNKSNAVPGNNSNSTITTSTSQNNVTTTTSSPTIETASSTARAPHANANHQRRKKAKNTEVFEPSLKPTDMRLVYDLNPKQFTIPITSRDVVLCPTVFSDYAPGEIYTRLINEMNKCGVPKDQLLKLWHGNDKIEGTHLICDDKRRWKDRCPTFELVINRLKDYFRMNIQATRLNWYADTSQWKPYHHDSAYVNPEKAAVQNFTVAVSFGCTRMAAFEHATTKTTLSLPQPDGSIYAFCKDTNGIWRHGILQDKVVRDEGRISIIAWGWVNDMEDLPPEND